MQQTESDWWYTQVCRCKCKCECECKCKRKREALEVWDRSEERRVGKECPV